MAAPLAPWPRLGLATVLFASPFAAHAEAEHSIEPGYWSYRASTMLTGDKDGQQCVPPDKIDEFLSGPHNRHYKCTYPVRVVKNGEAAFEGECVSKHDNRYRISLKGHYALQSFDLHGRVEGHLLGVAISVPISIAARRIGPDCPVSPASR